MPLRIPPADLGPSDVVSVIKDALAFGFGFGPFCDPATMIRKIRHIIDVVEVDPDSCMFEFCAWSTFVPAFSKLPVSQGDIHDPRIRRNEIRVQLDLH